MIAESIWQDKCRAYNLMYVILPLLLLLPPPSPPSPPLMLCFYLNFYMSFPCTKQIYGTRRANIHPTKQPTSFLFFCFCFCCSDDGYILWSLLIYSHFSPLFSSFFSVASLPALDTWNFICALCEKQTKKRTHLFFLCWLSHTHNAHIQAKIYEIQSSKRCDHFPQN